MDWNKEVEKRLQGKKIKIARYLTETEAEMLGWYRRGVVLQLDDDSLIFASSDDEGNNAGALHGQDPNGEGFILPVL